jgi:Phage terminase, small subunit
MPLSGRDPARKRQLDNLKPAPPAPPGNRRAVTHGAYAAIVRERHDRKRLQVFEALAFDVPLREGGELPRPDAVVVSLLAETLCRLEDVKRDIDDHGWRDRKTGDPKPVVTLERRLRREALDYAEALGMTPRSRARLGLDLAQLQRRDFALEAADDAERERRDSTPPGGAPK